MKMQWWSGATVAVLCGAAFVAACAAGEVASEKKFLSKHGTLDAEWEVRLETEKRTHYYVLLRTKTGVHETYEIIANDGQSAVTREQVGGIDGTGCYLLENGTASPWIMQQGPETLEGSTTRGDKTRTKCLEYKGGPGWSFIPEKDRKAAEPPPAPKPPPAAPAADMGTADGGAATPASGKDDIQDAIRGL